MPQDHAASTRRVRQRRIEDPPWWRGAIIYEIYPRSFLDTNGDGIGDLPGITRSLDYVASLGVDAIWICPFFPSPMKDFGYDVADYCGVDPMFGSLADFDALLQAAHARGLRVMIDQVWSHTSDQHPWFTESRQSRASAKADWYVWADPRPDGSPPNNWLSVFGGSAWQWDTRRRQYYLHHFLTCQPQLDLRQPRVIAELFAAARFWLDRGVDGFRLDAVDFMLHDPMLRDNPARNRPDGAPPTRPFAMQDHVYDMLHPDLLELLRRLREMMDEYPDRAALAEVSSEPGAFTRSLAYSDANAGRVAMAYTLDLMKRDLSAATFAHVVDQITDRGADGCMCWAFSNHDVVRAVTRWGSDGRNDGLARMLVALLLSLPGAACLYQGDELGLPEAEIRPEEIADPYGLTFFPAFKGRDGARTPMPWRATAPLAGFSTAARPWLPIGPGHKALAVDSQEAAADSTLNFARRFIAWRKAQPTLRWGNAAVIDIGEPVFGIERSYDGERIIALFNLSTAPITLPLDRLPPCTPLEGHGFAAMIGPDELRLPPHEALFGRLAD